MECNLSVLWAECILLFLHFHFLSLFKFTNMNLRFFHVVDHIQCCVLPHDMNIVYFFPLFLWWVLGGSWFWADHSDTTADTHSVWMDPLVCVFESPRVHSLGWVGCHSQLLRESSLGVQILHTFWSDFCNSWFIPLSFEMTLFLLPITPRNFPRNTSDDVPFLLSIFSMDSLGLGQHLNSLTMVVRAYCGETSAQLSKLQLCHLSIATPLVTHTAVPAAAEMQHVLVRYLTHNFLLIKSSMRTFLYPQP